MRLGELLVNKGLITQAQLKEALEAQLIYGGHLGTCLIEMSHVTEAALGRVLTEVTGAEYAAPEVFEDIPKYVIGLLSEKLVEKHVAVPFRLRDRTLDVAMVDPKNLLALDELSFASGHRLQPWISPEVRLFQAMERYYDIPRRLRYVTLCRQIDDGSSKGAVPMVALSSAHDLFAPKTPVRTRSAPPAAAPAAAPARQTATAVATAPPPRAATSAGRDLLERLSQQIAAVDNRERLAEIVLEFTAGHMARCILFKVKGPTASIWKTAGVSIDAVRANLTFELTSEPVFGLLEGEDVYRGPIPAEARFRGFYDALGMVMPGQALVLPVHLDDRLVVIFYGDDGPEGEIRGETEVYRRLMKKLGIALNINMLKRKILAV